MKERPINFTGDKVRATLDGRKSQERRVITAPRCTTLHGRQPAWDHAFRDRGDFGDYLHLPYAGGDYTDPREVQTRVYCPYGNIGDRLWVRETGSLEYAEFLLAGVEPRYLYAVTDDYEGPSRPSSNMPRETARLVLEITDIRVERLQDISEKDARAEGMTGYEWKPTPERFIGGPERMKYARLPQVQYRELWNRLNAKRGHGWETNPWVWVVSFKRIEEANECP